ncbi:MAG: hypothetical protein Q9173_001906 [Seirophora scorigena]
MSNLFSRISQSPTLTALISVQVPVKRIIRLSQQAVPIPSDFFAQQSRADGARQDVPDPLAETKMPNVAKAAVGSSLTATSANTTSGARSWARPHDVNVVTAPTEVEMISSKLRLTLSERIPKADWANTWAKHISARSRVPMCALRS